MEPKGRLAHCYAVLLLVLIGLVSLVSVKNLAAARLEGQSLNNNAEGRDQLETDLTACLFGREAFVDLNGGIRRLLGQREMNGVVRLENGYLAMPNDPAAPETLLHNADAAAALQTYLAERGIPFLYVATPFKIAADDPQLPSGVTDATNADLDTLLALMKERGVETLDLRDSIRQDGLDPYSLFFVTDHHWNTYGGFYAFTKIVERLGMPVDPALLDLANYTPETYPAWHFGSYGQRTGRLFAEPDDFTLLMPPVLPVIENTTNGESGVFDQLLYDRSVLQERDLSQSVTYDAALGRSQSSYRNPEAACGKKILIVCDSMASAVNPYLILAFREIKTLSAYYPEELTAAVLDEYQPDAVILMHYPTLATDGDSFVFTP